MDYTASHVVYVDGRVSHGLDGNHICKPSSIGEVEATEVRDGSSERSQDCLEDILDEIDEVRTSLRNILSVFDGVYPCASDVTCMDRIGSLENDITDDRAILVVIGTSSQDDSTVPRGRMNEELSRQRKPSSWTGSKLLRHISNEISNSNLSRRIVPLAMISDSESGTIPSTTPHKPTSRRSSGVLPLKQGAAPGSSGQNNSTRKILLEPYQIARCVDLGALDVLPSPLPLECLPGLVAHAYRACKEAQREREEQNRKRKARKLSWLGNHDERPYAYLREKMVSELMTGICNPYEVLRPVDSDGLSPLDATGESTMIQKVGSWSYSGHDYNDDELIHVACVMLEHALSLPELEKWRISLDELRTFLMASRAAYNNFVNYHNFRHVIDVMQAIFCFLIQVGTLPAFPRQPTSSSSLEQASPIAALLKPFDALTLLITAIGHDVGHPGVNNAFLVSLNAPLAQLYNDKSVLEAFHCAAYSQILRRHWKAAFEDIPMRGLMINSILATDMGVHMRYMSDLGNLQEKLHHNGGTDGWSAQILDEYRILTCALLIKCADISNVARPFNIALKWADSLQLEFANQGVMERELGIPTTLFGGPPELGNLVKLGRSQISFMNIFARPLFEAVTDILPAMAFAVEEIKTNQGLWAEKIKRQEECEEHQHSHSIDRPLSPRSLSPNRPASQPESSHPEGLPASNALHNDSAISPNLSAVDAEASRRSQSIANPQQNLVADSHFSPSDASRRSSSGQALGQISPTSNSATSFSRRSSGALSATNIPHSIITTRRTSNSSPSQLQLGLESRSQTNSSFENSENRQPNGHGSDDTLSQMHFTQTIKNQSDGRLGSSSSGMGSGGSGGPSSRASASENTRSGQSTASQPPNRPNASSGHHRSSSGAHTTNTNLSQSAPYSPTGTQATSFLTVESDENKSQSRLESSGSTDRHHLPLIVNVDEHFQESKGLDGTHETDVKTSVVQNGSMKESSNIGYRSLSKKSSRFNFSFFKKKGKGVEASP